MRLLPCSLGRKTSSSDQSKSLSVSDVFPVSTRLLKRPQFSCKAASSSVFVVVSQKILQHISMFCSSDTYLLHI